MKPITDARVMASHAAMCRSMPAATDRQYPTIGDVLCAGIYRAATRKEMVAAQSIWDSEGGATDQRTTHGEAGTGPLVPQAH